jgi:hypothetical protein
MPFYFFFRGSIIASYVFIQCRVSVPLGSGLKVVMVKTEKERPVGMTVHRFLTSHCCSLQNTDFSHRHSRLWTLSSMNPDAVNNGNDLFYFLYYKYLLIKIILSVETAEKSLTCENMNQEIKSNSERSWVQTHSYFENLNLNVTSMTVADAILFISKAVSLTFPSFACL